MREVTDQPATITITEAARLLGISRASAYAAAHRGELPVLRLGRRLVVPRKALERQLAGDESAAA
jgi:excisionase family DNA binding protein